MENVKNILVALDLTSIDNHLIEYSSFLAEKFEIENVYFVHNIKKYEISELFADELNEVNLDQLIGDELNEKIENKFKANANWEVLISEDSNTESLIDYIVNKYQIHLTLIGNKSSKDGTGVVTAKLLRLLKCSILSVPKTAELSFENIWVGTDFSGHSRKSFQFIEQLRKKFPLTVNAVHVYQVPIQFSPYVPKADAMVKIEKHLQQKSTKFFNKFVISKPESVELIYAKDKSVSEKFLFEIEKKKPDLVILSDKGGNNISSLLIGSLTEEIFDESLTAPLLIVK
ncbi:universal stress protein [Mesonia aestuariivivens]|uniref:Universal stress protein n=1 Tax=Mesonia aestuariivivens TaxID=2796128 RepID=A0ABS6VZ57_9FLAO|nr:universal stress protein [Mesonia aestuariivivens]MBW2960870.1 universal stress protein [Mesonia aestuariivivens]